MHLNPQCRCTCAAAGAGGPCGHGSFLCDLPVGGAPAAAPTAPILSAVLRQSVLLNPPPVALFALQVLAGLGPVGQLSVSSGLPHFVVYALLGAFVLHGLYGFSPSTPTWSAQNRNVSAAAGSHSHARLHRALEGGGICARHSAGAHYSNSTLAQDTTTSVCFPTCRTCCAAHEASLAPCSTPLLTRAASLASASGASQRPTRSWLAGRGCLHP